MNRLFSFIEGFCALSTFLIMVLVVVDVALRSLRIGSIPSGVEIVALSVVLIVFLPAAALQRKRQHLRVTVLLERMPQRFKALADIVSWILFLTFFVILLWQGFNMASYSWKSKEIMIMSLWPVYPFRFCLVLGCLFMVIQLLLDIKSSWHEFIKKQDDSTKVI